MGCERTERSGREKKRAYSCKCSTVAPKGETEGGSGSAGRVEDSREDKRRGDGEKSGRRGDGGKVIRAEVPKVIIFMRHAVVHSPPAACVIMCLGLQPH